MNKLILFTLGMLLFLFSCETLLEDEISTNDGITTIFNIHLTDNPIDLEEVNIDIQQVVVKGASGELVELETNAGVYNLLDLQNGVEELIASSAIELDEIRQIRLILGDNNTIVAGSDTFDLKVPSGSESGLKIKVCLDLEDLSFFELLLDFDAEASIHCTEDGAYMLKPVIRVMNPEAKCDDDDNDYEDDDYEIELDDLPEAIRNRLENDYEDYEFDIEKGKTCGEEEVVYIIEAEKEDEAIKLFFDLEGNLIQTATEVSIADLPQTVLDSIALNFPNYSLEEEDVYRIERSDAEIWYLVELEKEDEEVKVTLKEDGSIVCKTNDEDEDDEDDDDDKEDEDESIKDLPENVQSYLEMEYEGYEFEVENGTICGDEKVYLIEAEKEDDEVYLYFDLEGNFLQKSYEISDSDLPEAVLTTLSNEFDDYDLEEDDVYKIERFDGTIWYMVELEQEDEDGYVILTDDGSIVCKVLEEEQDDEDDDDEDEDESIKDLPENVQSYLEMEYEGYEFEVENGTICGDEKVYLIEAEKEDDEVYLYFDLEGNFLQKSYEISDSDLPEAVLTTLSNEFDDYDLEEDDVYKIERFDGAIWYMVELEQEDEDGYVILTDDGSIVCKVLEEEQDDEDDDDKEDENKEVPEAIKTFLDENYPDYSFDLSEGELCDEDDLYLLKGKNQDQRVRLYFDEDWTLLQVHTPISNSDLPQPVLDAVSSEFSGYALRENKSWEVTTDETGVVSYLVSLKERNGSDKLEVVFGADGSVICKEDD